MFNFLSREKQRRFFEVGHEMRAAWEEDAAADVDAPSTAGSAIAGGSADFQLTGAEKAGSVTNVVELPNQTATVSNDEAAMAATTQSSTLTASPTSVSAPVPIAQISLNGLESRVRDSPDVMLGDIASNLMSPGGVAASEAGGRSLACARQGIEYMSEGEVDLARVPTRPCSGHVYDRRVAMCLGAGQP